MWEKTLLIVAASSLALAWAWLPRHANWKAWTAVLSVWFVSSNLWKTAMIQDHLDSAVHLPRFGWAWQACSLVGCLFLCQTISRRYWVRLLWLLHLVIAWLFLFDQIYERYFDDLPGMYLLTQISQARAALPSALEIWHNEDWAFIADVFLFLPLLLRASPRPPARLRLVPVWLGTVILALFMTAELGADNLRILRLRFRNVAAVQILGLFHYHFYDVLQNFYSHWENLFDRSYDQAMLQQVCGDSHRSIVENTPWRGRYKGKNVLMFQMESLEAFVLNRKVCGQEVTPFLNSLARESFVGTLQDQTGQGRSSDGEFILLNSLLPPGERPLVYAYPDNTFCALPALLARHGYHTNYGVPYYGSFWNCRFMSHRYGFKTSLFREELPNIPEKTIGWGLNDVGLVEKLQEYWLDYKQPLFSYTVTMMGHHPYRELKPSQEKLKLSRQYKKTMLARYLQICRERDEEWRQIVDHLKEWGYWDNSLVVLVGDHDARIPYEEMALLKGDAESFDEVDKCEWDRVLCLIHAPDGKLRGHSPPIAAQVDVTPTLLHLLGIDDPTGTVGLNMLSRYRRHAVVSKGGYALDPEHVVVDDAGIWTVYDRKTHQALPDANPPARQAMQAWYALSRNILRLDLVPTMQQLSTR